jgi:predicted RNA binding protein YcfA (HicA-like mRNA interferase family)
VPAKLRTLSGDDVLRILAGFGFELTTRRGSHAKLRRLTSDGSKQTLHIPLHRELRKGTLRAIVQQAAMYVPEQELRRQFYSD